MIFAYSLYSVLVGF